MLKYLTHKSAKQNKKIQNAIKIINQINMQTPKKFLHLKNNILFFINYLFKKLIYTHFNFLITIQFVLFVKFSKQLH